MKTSHIDKNNAVAALESIGATWGEICDSGEFTDFENDYQLADDASEFWAAAEALGMNQSDALNIVNTAARKANRTT